MTILTNKCFSDSSGIKYCPIKDTYNCIVGTNQTIEQNAISSAYSLSYLHIPSKINSHRVIEIGRYAFFSLKTITQIRIDEGIRQINDCAFYELPHLSLVILPSTVEFLGYYAISGINIINGVYYTTNGTLTIIFQPISKLKILLTGAIERKSNVVVHYCGYGYPQFQDRPFYQINNVTLYSFHQFTMNDTFQSIIDYTLCPTLKYFILKTLQRKPFIYINVLVFSFILI